MAGYGSARSGPAFSSSSAIVHKSWITVRRSSASRTGYRTLNLLLIFLLKGCALYQVKTDFDPAVEFTSLHSFAWFEKADLTEVTSSPSPLLIARIKKSVSQYLQIQGYRLVTKEEKPDFMVNFVLESKDRRGVRVRPFSFGMGFNLHHDYVYVRSTYETYHFTEGSLSVDFYLGENGHPFWRGSANKNFIGFNADVSEQTVNDVVESILKHFPP